MGFQQRPGAVQSVLAACVIGAQALDNGLARTPQMGYNTWYDLECSGYMNESTLKQIADAMVETGLRDLGYQYLNLDDCWAKGRHSDGAVFADPSKFPSGTLKPLADYVHSSWALQIFFQLSLRLLPQFKIAGMIKRMMIAASSVGSNGQGD